MLTQVFLIKGKYDDNNLSAFQPLLNPATMNSSMTSTRTTPMSGAPEMDGREISFEELSMTMPCTSSEADCVFSTGFVDAVPTPLDIVVLKRPETPPEDERLDEELL